MKWTVSECDTDVQIIPTGEETFHSWSAECSCHPQVSLQLDGKIKFVHQSYELFKDNLEEMLEIAYHSPLHNIRQEIDC